MRSLADRQPYKAALERDYHWLGEAMVKHYHGDDADLGLLMGAVESAFEGMTVQAFSDEVTTWLRACLSSGAETPLPLLCLRSR